MKTSTTKKDLIDTIASLAGVNREEAKAILRHPLAALKIKKNKDVAIAKTTELFGENGYDDASDAFRHAYFNAINTADSNAKSAKEFGDAHEAMSENTEYARKMDLHNNKIGREVATNNPRACEEELAVIIFEKVKNGELVMLNEDGTGLIPTSISKMT